MMRDITVNVGDYLSAEELKSIAIERVSNFFDQGMREPGSLRGLLSNVAYEIVSKGVGECLGGDIEDIIKINTTRVINEMSSYNVFGSSSDVPRERTRGRILLDEIVLGQKILLEARVKEMIARLPEQELEDKLLDAVQEIIRGGLFAAPQARGAA